MNMREIEVISELINYKSFSDASYTLPYSPSVITKYISNVEKELGIKLFIRSNKSRELSLTPEGKVLIDSILRINMNYQHMMELAKQLKGTYENVIRIGSQPRFGNLIEQEIIALFWLNNPKAKIERVKMFSMDLMKLLGAGRLDAIFVTLHGEIKIEEYFRDLINNSDIDIIFLSAEKNMYLGISDKYLPGKEEAKFKEFKDFTFAFPFPKSSDTQETKAIETYNSLASENGFKLKTVYLGGNDNAAFKLATKAPVAVATTNIPALYKGIKFVKISDWCAFTNLYFVYLKSNKKGMLINLKKIVKQYTNRAEIKNI